MEMNPQNITLISVAALLVGIPIMVCICTIRAVREEQPAYDWSSDRLTVTNNPGSVYEWF